MSTQPTSQIRGTVRRQVRASWVRDLKIAWINIGRGAVAHDTALSICRSEDMDVIQIQEPWWRPGSTTKTHPVYEIHKPVDNWETYDDRPQVLTYVKRHIWLKVSPCQQISRDLI
jgi:hypothetical protein